MIKSLRLADLAAWLQEEILSSARGTVAILAGHFALFSRGGTPSDLLDDRAPRSDAGAEMIRFTRLTWEVACEAVRRTKAQAPRLVLLADDIQHIDPPLKDQRIRESLKAELVRLYFDSVPELPRYHARVLRDQELNGSAVLPHSPTRWLFSENELRIKLVRHLKRDLDHGPRPRSGVTTNEDRSDMSVTHPEFGVQCLVQSGHASCAGGYLELVSELSGYGISKLIALVPMRCLAPVLTGAALVGQLGTFGKCRMINAAIPDPLSGADAIIDGD